MKMLKVIGKIIAVIFCIGYFLGLGVLMGVLFTSNLLSRSYYTEILKNVDLKEIKVSDMGYKLDDIDENASIEEVLIEYVNEAGIDKETALAIVNNNEIREVLGNFIGDYVNYQMGGEKPEIAREDVEIVFKNPDVVKALRQQPTEEDINKVYTQLVDLTKDMAEEKVAFEKFPSEVQTTIEIMDDGMIFIYIALFVLCSYLIISFLIWSFVKPLKYIGISTIMVGGLMLIIRFSIKYVVQLFAKENVELINALLPSVLSPMLLIGMLCLIIGIVMIVCYKLISKKKNNEKEEGI